MAANAFMDMKSAFINEIASLCEIMGADIVQVAGSVWTTASGSILSSRGTRKAVSPGRRGLWPGRPRSRPPAKTCGSGYRCAWQTKQSRLTALIMASGTMALCCFAAAISRAEKYVKVKMIYHGKVSHHYHFYRR